MTLIYSPEALADLDRVWYEVWEASRDLTTTERYIEDLRSTIRNKTAFPKSGSPLLWNGVFTGIYFVPFKTYLAFYRVSETALEVGRILPMKSDYMKTLFGISSHQSDEGTFR